MSTGVSEAPSLAKRSVYSVKAATSCEQMFNAFVLHHTLSLWLFIHLLRLLSSSVTSARTLSTCTSCSKTDQFRFMRRLGLPLYYKANWRVICVDIRTCAAGWMKSKTRLEERSWPTLDTKANSSSSLQARRRSI